MSISTQVRSYIHLMRFDKPIGICLVLWPTLWALWLASYGDPHLKILLVFLLGLVLMRSAGCIFNDLADRNFDKHVTRTKDRPITSGKISAKNALLLGLLLSFCAFLLVLIFCNRLTVYLSFAGLGFAILYPLMKRFTHLPQFGLGIAFSWGVPMSFAAIQGRVTISAWILFLCAAVWPVIYDTMYAMVDREDDKKIGIKSTAILFDSMDRVVIGLLQTLFVGMLCLIGMIFALDKIYFVCIGVVCGLFIYQQWLIKDRNEINCFAAFLNNNWVGFFIFFGIAASYLVNRP